MEFYNRKTIKNIDIIYQDLYFTPEYGEACEYSDDADWELCKYKDLIYVYLKKPIKNGNKTYYDLITPYGYSGYYYEDEKTFEEFIPIFRKKAKEKNYVTEVLRQNPYLNITINNYEIISSKTIYAIKVDNFDDYFKNVLNSKKRNMYNKAKKNKFTFELHNVENNILQDKFIDLYNQNMRNVEASNYYYFNSNYFNSIEKIDNSYLATVNDNSNNIIGAALIYKFNDLIHYHLSCNDKSSNCITDFLLINVVKELCINKIFILGCGCKNLDSLSRFKKKLSNKEYDYVIYKNIINKEVYEELSKNKDNDFFPIYRK